MKRLTKLAALTAFSCGQLAHSPASAQPRRPDARPVADGWSATVGAAAIASPAWLGSKETSLSLFPDLSVRYGDVLFASVPEGLGWNAVNADGWKAGPLIKLRFGRDEKNGGSPFLISGGSDALQGMGNVKATAEAGAFVEKAAGPAGRWRIRAEVRKGMGGHEGVVGDVSIRYRTRMGRTIVSAGPRAAFATREFMQTYFGVSADQSGRTGLARYSAEGGVLSYGVGGTVVRPIGKRSAVTLFAGYDRLGGPAGASPLIQERGRRAQFTIGLGYGFRFGL